MNGRSILAALVIGGAMAAISLDASAQMSRAAPAAPVPSDSAGMKGPGGMMGQGGMMGPGGMMDMMRSCQGMMGSGGAAAGGGMSFHLPPGNAKLEAQMHAEMMQKMGEIAARYAERARDPK